MSVNYQGIHTINIPEEGVREANKWKTKERATVLNPTEGLETAISATCTPIPPPPKERWGHRAMCQKI